MRFNFNNIGYSRVLREADEEEPEMTGGEDVADGEDMDYTPDAGMDDEEETPDDGGDVGGEEEDGADTDDAGEEGDYMPGNMDDDTGEDAGEETGEDPEAGGEDDGTGEDVGVEDDMGDDTGADTRQTLFDDLNAIEDELFADLSDEQKAFKHKELKKNMVTLYDSTKKAIGRLNLIPKTDENVKVLKLAARTLVELKDMLHINLTETYYTRTFFENDILYKKCLVQYDAVSRLLAELVPESEHEDASDFEARIDAASEEPDNEIN